MNRRRLSILLIVAGLVIFSPAFAAEKIDSFAATVTIGADATIQVSERIDYNFGDSERHGIFRDIPVSYQARGGKYSLRLSDISIADETGRQVEFTSTRSGKVLKLKIGNKDAYVTGIKTYIISYRVGRAINYFTDHDELYWNITGNDWQVPIDSASVKVELPGEISRADLRTACYQGPLGSSEACLISDLESKSGAVSMMTANLGPGEGMTVVIGWPKGLVAKPSAWQTLIDIARDNWVVAIPFLVLFMMIYLWYTRGRDPKGRGAVVAEYEAPDKLAPAEIGTIVDEKADRQDISAQMISLAVRGYLKITKLPDEGMIFKTHDYEFQKLKPVDDLENDFDKKILNGIFGGQAQTKKLSELKNKFYKDWQEVSKMVYEATVKKGYFVKNPNTVRAIYWVIAFLVGVIPQFFVISLFGAYGAVSLGVAAVIIFVFGFVMPRKTKLGAETKEKILGLREYLSVAEADRIKFHNAPEKNPERFEKLLPYAMALGVEQAWAKQFEGIYNQNPSWYSDSSGGTFNSLVLVHSLNGFSSQTNSALTSRPGGAAGGGSGFGGGGFSGGGFGGGGGGSW